MLKKDFFKKFFNLSSKNKIHAAAFTLAEVLIVIGIIGIIAEMTIPALINNIDDQVTLVALKKEASVIQEAIAMAKNDNGEIDYWYTPPGGGNDFSAAPSAVNAILSKYLKLSVNCDTASGCMAPGYKVFSNTWVRTINLDSSSSYSKMILADGSSLAFDIASGGSANIQVINFYIDVNGLKGPNRIGYDTFAFLATGELINYNLHPGVLAPRGYDVTNGDLALNCSSTASMAPGTGWSCSAWAYIIGNLDYKYTNDLNWATKTHK